jgi:glutamate dehydrogenase (NAD(P)+)
MEASLSSKTTAYSNYLALGPYKGGARFTPSLTLGESAVLAIWMSWKYALASLPYGGAKGGVAVDPGSLTLVELQRISRRYMLEMIPFVGPQTDIMGPDLGTNEQIMAWFMDPTPPIQEGQSLRLSLENQRP